MGGFNCLRSVAFLRAFHSAVLEAAALGAFVADAVVFRAYLSRFALALTMVETLAGL